VTAVTARTAALAMNSVLRAMVLTPVCVRVAVFHGVRCFE